MIDIVVPLWYGWWLN